MASKQRLADAANDAVRLIAEATGKATAAIASAAQDAVKLLASDASTAAKVVADKADVAHSGNCDHDLLVILDTKMEGLKCDIKDLKDGTSRRIETLELEKLNAKESYPVLYKKSVDDKLDDHETRIRIAETAITRILTYGTVAVILAGVAEVILGKLIH